ncbi:late secretory pathway protein AVL9 homolog [Anthonomus grandis grandis]|uniref:late secretory pathway protein AVL9 homolog n=1 Tax=Anthonomus grandis grandis TaxID=2921223 RepID=UPI002166A0B7|nr:late secretory pathway protein AVL9 homolog [Anthonomus grandis grandis]
MHETDPPILYVLVIGFHHKKGCQVEYSFPPLVPGAPNECPAGWKYLPTLALPDGSHNFEEDTVFFHLPSLTNPNHTVFGISCFRQIPVDKLKNKTSDITRTTVQKSVCVLSRIPLYGQIQVKMALITHAYFKEGDFSKVSILEDTFHHLNAVLGQADIKQQTYVGLSTRDFILQWKHKAVLLFKLLLLEKRVIFFKSPVLPLCSTILTLVSLFPDMIEKGLHQSACIRLSRPMSPMPEFSDDDSPLSTPTRTQNGDLNGKKADETSLNMKTVEVNNENGKDAVVENGIEITESISLPKEESNGVSSLGEKTSSLRRDISSDTIADSVQSNMNYLSQLKTENCGFPLAVFTKGALCLPYLSLPYLDLLTDVNVRSYIVGATNVLFKQKRQLFDILVDIDGGRIECQDLTLRKHLHLTTEDLRFADYIVKHVSEERHDVFLDGVGYEGGDDWIRAQFRVYLMSLLRTSILPDGCREADHFNINFVSAWKETHNYKIWLSGNHAGILDVHPGHPFAGQLSVADMKLRFAHTMQTTEGGRKLGQAMTSTGRAVATTSKAVGGAISQAKGAFSSWWNNLLVSPEPGLTKENNEEEIVQAEEPLPAVDCTLRGNSLANGSLQQENVKNAIKSEENLSSIKEISNMNGQDLCLNGTSVEHKIGEVHTV